MQVWVRRYRSLAASAALHAGATIVLVLLAATSGPRDSQIIDATSIVLLGPGDIVASMPGTPAHNDEPSSEAVAVADDPAPGEAAAAVVEVDPLAASEELASLTDLAAPSELAGADPRLIEAAFSAEIAASVRGGGGCNLTGHLREALQRDAILLDGLAALPRDARSVANAVMVWDGAWVGAQAARGAPMAQHLRDAIVGLLRSAPPVCREADVVGPQFIILDDPRGATVLVLGSGEWRWDDVIESVS